MVEEDTREGDALAFKSCGQPLTMVSSFIYLDWTLTARDDDWPVVVGNLQKARWTCERLSWILGWEGADM